MPTINDYEPTLSGQFDFKGHFTGTFDKPVVEGDLSAESAGVHSQSLGKLTGHLLLSTDEARGQDVGFDDFQPAARPRLVSAFHSIPRQRLEH